MPLLTLVLCTALTLLLCRCIYRITLHPLSKIPGPLLNCISSWPDFFSAASGDRHIRLWQLHEIYGPTVRIAPNRVSTNTITAFKSIYDARANVKQGPLYQTFIASNRGRVDLLDSEGEVHSRKRKIISRAFSEKGLRLKEDSIIEHQNAWLEEVTKTLQDGGDHEADHMWTAPINVSEWLPYLTTDIVGEVGFGKSFELTTNKRFRFLPQTFKGLVTTNFMVGHLPPTLQSGLNSILKSPIMSLVIPPEVVNFDKFTNELISERVAQELSERPATAFEKGNDDFVTLFRDEDGSLSTSSIDEIKSEATTLLVAGSDTVSTAISGLLFYLAHNPRCLEKLNVEIRSRFSTVVDIRRGYELSGAKYLRACIDETLRMSPPTPGYLGRTVLEGGITIDGQYFPAGVELGAPIYALHHNSDYYPRPNDFWPERWLQEIDGKTRAETISQDPALARAAFAAFSTGPHGCAGKEFAYLEITLFIARLVYQYNVQLADDEKRNFGEGQGPYGPWGRRIRGHFQIKDHFTGTGYGPWIQFRRR